jgi:hypothetical protein
MELWSLAIPPMAFDRLEIELPRKQPNPTRHTLPLDLFLHPELFE